MSWTDQGARTAADSVKRYEAAREDLAAHGLEIKDIFWTVGPYDIVTIAEAADDETATAALLRPRREPADDDDARLQRIGDAEADQEGGQEDAVGAHS